MDVSKKPIFFFLHGSPKSGTTWLHQNLIRSPHFYNGGLKEWCFWRFYFSSYLTRQKIISNLRKKEKRWSYAYSNKSGQMLHRKAKKIAFWKFAYHNPDTFIQNATDCVLNDDNYKVLGDLSPGTGVSLGVNNLHDLVRLMKNCGFQSKAVWLIRDPLSRSLSTLRMKLVNKRFSDQDIAEIEKDQNLIRKLIENNLVTITNASRYDAQWDSIINTRIPTKVVHFDDLFSQVTLDEIFEYLGLEKQTMISGKVNSGASMRISDNNKQIIAKNLRPTYEFFQNYFKETGLPKSWQHSMEYL